MLEIAVPGRGTYRLQHLVLDFNGTLALDGELLEGVAERLQAISRQMDITIATADTFGTAGALKDRLAAKVLKIEPEAEDTQKLALIEHLGKDNTVCIGNGSNDFRMLRAAALGICILGREGAYAESMTASDLIFTDINDALDLLLKPQRFVASLRR